MEGFSVGSGVPDQPFGDVSAVEKNTVNDFVCTVISFHVLTYLKLCSILFIVDDRQEETQHGAKSRAEHAYQAYKKKNGVAPHLAVGLEGGLEWSKTIPDENGHDSLWCMAWMALYGKRNAFVVDLLASPDSKFYQPDKKPIFGMAKTGTFLLPSSLAALIEDGMELGDADDKVFGRVNSKQGSGTVGVLTDGLIDRARYYEHALILALVPWMRPDVYSSKEELSIGSRLFCRSGSR